MIKKASQSDYEIVAVIANKLWSSHNLDELKNEFKEILKDKNSCVFLYYIRDYIGDYISDYKYNTDRNTPIGFCQLSLRYDYVEGTTFSPVAYLEGIYVEKEYRKLGVAKELIQVSENWAREKGVKEFASDCELNNIISENVHKKLGFREVNRIICFKKDL